jgi:hypothetical protein
MNAVGVYYAALQDLTVVLLWFFWWLGWLLLIGLVCAGSCWACRRIEPEFWLRAKPPGWPRRRLRSEASRGIAQIESFLDQTAGR